MYHNGGSIGKTLFSSSTAGRPSACPCVSVGSRWPYLSGSLLSGLQIRAGFLGCHCRARVQTNPHSRVQADCLLPLCCCQRRLADQRHHRVLTEAEQDWCPRWNNSVYQGKAAVLVEGIHLLLESLFGVFLMTALVCLQLCTVSYGKVKLVLKHNR